MPLRNLYGFYYLYKQTHFEKNMSLVVIMIFAIIGKRIQSGVITSLQGIHYHKQEPYLALMLLREQPLIAWFTSG
jgi:hypothetical protein